MESQVLKIAIFVALGVLFFTWFLIAYSLLYRKIRRRSLRKIEETFADLVSTFLYGNETEKISFLDIQRIFRKIGITENRPANVQYLIDLMIRTQRSLLGRQHQRLQVLYTQIPPYKASYNKMQSRKWYLQARGIREIYEMNLPQYVNEITKFRNHPNIFVRREAQIALVVFLGWESLRFLPYLKRKLALWQQIKIVEKLHDLYPQPKVGYLRKAYNVKNDYGKELIMRIIRKYELSEELDYLVSHLSHPSFSVKETALYCLETFSLGPHQVEALKQMMPGLDNLKQQSQLLAIIQASDREIDTPFYLDLLENSQDLLKLKVAEILWNNGQMNQVQKYYRDQYKTTSELMET